MVDAESTHIGLQLYELARSLGVNPSEIHGRVLQVLERSLTMHLGETHKVHTQIMKAGTADWIDSRLGERRQLV